MNNKKFTIEEEIQKTLDCMDKIERVSINPWLPTRLKEKLKNKKGESFKNGYFFIKLLYFCASFILTNQS